MIISRAYGFSKFVQLNSALAEIGALEIGRALLGLVEKPELPAFPGKRETGGDPPVVLPLLPIRLDLKRAVLEDAPLTGHPGRVELPPSGIQNHPIRLLDRTGDPLPSPKKFLLRGPVSKDRRLPAPG